MTNRLVLKDHEHELRRISCEIHEVAMAIEDDMAAGELMKLERAVRAFAIDLALRARKDAERTPEEWFEFNQYMLYLFKIDEWTADTILKEMEEAIEEESREEIKNV